MFFQKMLIKYGTKVKWKRLKIKAGRKVHGIILLKMIPLERVMLISS